MARRLVNEFENQNHHFKLYEVDGKYELEDAKTHETFHAIVDQEEVQSKSKENAIHHEYGANGAKWANQCKCGEVMHLVDDLFVMKGENGLWGMRDKSGKVLVEPEYDFIFVNPDDAPYIKVVKNQKIGIIDEGGKIIILPVYRNIFYNSDVDLFSYQAETGAFGLVDKNGHEICSPSFNQYSRFKNGYALIYTCIDDRLAINLFGFIDKTGKVIIEPKYLYADDFDEDGHAKVMDDHKKFVIDTKGNPV